MIYCKIVSRLIDSNNGSDYIRPYLCLSNSLNVINGNKYIEQDSQRIQNPFKRKRL